ncbi:YD repeat-containing protein [Agreia sp. COWG]|nr:YD repeat-containing protein [Agreia sp. COWG]
MVPDACGWHWFDATSIVSRAPLEAGVYRVTMTVETVEAGAHRVCRRAIINAPAAELFELVAQPRRHTELDGSGTVGETMTGPERLDPGASFTTKMTQRGVPYSITSRVTEFDEGRVIEWRHPMGHRWRWEFEPRGEASTSVTETFDYSFVGPIKSGMFRIMGLVNMNADGIEETLRRLQKRYATRG